MGFPASVVEEHEGGAADEAEGAPDSLTAEGGPRVVTRFCAEACGTQLHDEAEDREEDDAGEEDERGAAGHGGEVLGFQRRTGILSCSPGRMTLESLRPLRRMISPAGKP